MFVRHIEIGIKLCSRVYRALGLLGVDYTKEKGYVISVKLH
jgi:hypothetical protein